MQDETSRKQLLRAVLGRRQGTAVDIREIQMQPGQVVGRHLHPTPAVGYISAGTAIVEIQGESARTLTAGSAFYEPPDRVVARFGNASNSEAITLVAFYLLDGDQELIRMLDESSISAARRATNSPAGVEPARATPVPAQSERNPASPCCPAAARMARVKAFCNG